MWLLSNQGWQHTYIYCPRTQKLRGWSPVLVLERKTWDSRHGDGLGRGTQNQQSPLLVSHNSTTAQRGGTLATLPLEGEGGLQEWSKPKPDPQIHPRAAGTSAGTQVTKAVLERKLLPMSWEALEVAVHAGCVGADLLWSIYVYNDTTEKWDALNIVQTKTLYVLSGKNTSDGYLVESSIQPHVIPSFLLFFSGLRLQCILGK